MRVKAPLVLMAFFAAAAFGSYSGKIVFTSDRDGNHEVYVINADGTGEMRLTNHKAYDDQPVLSPDGKSVVFISNRDGNHELYLIGAGGKDLRRLTTTSHSEIDPSFSADGKWIYFTSMAEGDKDIRRLQIESGKVEEVISGDGDQFMARAAADGALAYVENGGDEEVIYTKGGTKKNLTASPGIDTLPSFSPDGKEIYFTSNRGGDYDLFAVKRDGTGLREVITLESLEGRASAAPAGGFLAVASDKDGDLEIYIFSAEGEELQQLTDNHSEDYEPYWGK